MGQVKLWWVAFCLWAGLISAVQAGKPATSAEKKAVEDILSGKVLWMDARKLGPKVPLIIARMRDDSNRRIAKISQSFFASVVTREEKMGAPASAVKGQGKQQKIKKKTITFFKTKYTLVNQQGRAISVTIQYALCARYFDPKEYVVFRKIDVKLSPQSPARTLSDWEVFYRYKN